MSLLGIDLDDLPLAQRLQMICLVVLNAAAAGPGTIPGAISTCRKCSRACVLIWSRRAGLLYVSGIVPRR